MFDLIFGESFKQAFTPVIIIAAVFIFLYFFAKYKPIQALAGCVAFLALILSGILSFGHINVYYSAEGGVIGEITSLLKKNEVEITEEVDSINFDFKNVVLVKNAKGKYSASFTTDKILRLNDDENYFIYVNNEPCTTVQCEVKDIYATYSYIFMNRDAGEYKVLAEDVITFYFALYDNYSYLYIEVEQGEKTAGLWNSYFNKNDFKVSINAVSETMYSNSEYKTVSLFANNLLYKKIKLLKGVDYVLPDTIDLKGFMLNCWKDSEGNKVEEITNITENFVLTADLTWLTFSTEYIDLGIEAESTLIWNDGENAYYSAGAYQYKLNTDLNKWEEYTWNGLTNFYGSMVWSINDEYFYSYNDQQYKLNKQTNNWETVTWGGLTSFNGNYVWTDGENVYYSHHTNYSIYTDDSPVGNYKLNINTNEWQPIQWNEFNELDATCIWTDKTDMYFSYGTEQYKLNKITQSWEECTWNGFEISDNDFIWNTESNTFYSQGDKQYILTGNNTWKEVTWIGDKKPIGSQVWTNGINYFYSSGFGTYKIKI